MLPYSNKPWCGRAGLLKETGDMLWNLSSLLQGNRAEWRRTSGTLIGLQSHGKLHGALSDRKEDQVDINIDLIVGRNSAGTWFDF